MLIAAKQNYVRYMSHKENRERSTTYAYKARSDDENTLRFSHGDTAMKRIQANLPKFSTEIKSEPIYTTLKGK